MPLIEGVGDEVTLILGGFLLCIILMFAWLSTHTADIPLLREVGVIVVELSQRRSRTQNTASEERVGRDDTDGSIERGSASTNDERQQYDVDLGFRQTSESHPVAGATSENNNIAVGVNSHETPSSGESSGLPTRTADISTSSGLFPEHAGTVTSIPDQATITSASQEIRRKSADQASSDNLRESESLVPKASVVVDDSKGFAFPSEDEIRQRRVQYFQANKSTEGVSGEAQASPDDNKPSSLSELSTSGSEHTRHLGENSHSSHLPNTAHEDVAITSRTSHQASAPAAGSNNVVTGSPDEHVTDSQIINGQEENTTASSKIRVKLKYMNETQRLVYAEPLDTIGDFRRTHFQAELQDNKWVRFIYNGQDLRDDARTLQACNVGDNCTMHCLITAQTQAHLPRAAAAEEDEDSFMGAMMYPLFTVIILIVWYFRFTYRQYFSAMSTVCLIGISFLLALSYISSLRTSDRIPPQRRLDPTTPPPPGGVRGEHQHID